MDTQIQIPLTWEDNDTHTAIWKEFAFPNFAQAMVFADHIAAFAEELNHHPVLHISWGKVVVELTTHDVGGISEKDIMLAQKIDTIS